MNNKMFKLSVISSALLATTQVSAALYNVVEVKPSTTFDYESAYGVAIEPATTSSADDNCFVSSTAGSKSCESYILAGETRLAAMNAGEAVDGVSFREEAPFGMDNHFTYIQSEGEFYDYCKAELRYSTCSAWASARWDIWYKEYSGSSATNSIAFIEGAATPIDETKNVVINSLYTASNPVGIESELNSFTELRRDSLSALTPGAVPSSSDYIQSRAWKTDGTYTVGSVSKSADNDQGRFYTSKAAIWANADSSQIAEIDWESGTGSTNQHLAQGSIRDFTSDGTTIYAVGYNSYNSSENYMNATVFVGKVATFDDSTQWHSKVVENTRVRDSNGSGNIIHNNSVIVGVNNNRVAIGSAKRDGNAAKARAAANRLFIIPNVAVSSLTATFPSGGILFDGAGGKAGAINNYNEIVGQIDFDKSSELDGKPRRKRGFIYPYVAGYYDDSDTTEYANYLARAARFKNKAWYLDDLTNGSNGNAGNNQYRVIDATDINDAGVISATAIKCEGGYDTTAHNSTCGGGSQTETTVAVKLVPVLNATASNITERGIDENSTSERSGGSFGLWGFILLGLAWFRRK